VGAGYEGERAAPGGARGRRGSRSRRGAGRAVAGRRCRSSAQRRTAPVRAGERKEKGLPLRVGPAVREGGEGRGLGAAQVEAGRLGRLFYFYIFFKMFFTEIYFRFHNCCGAAGPCCPTAGRKGFECK